MEGLKLYKEKKWKDGKGRVERIERERLKEWNGKGERMNVINIV